MRASLHVRGVVVAAGMAASAAAAMAGVVTQPVALTGTDGVYGPGLGAGVAFTTLDQQQPNINASGQVIFRGLATGAHGVWIHSSGVNSNVAMAGGAQPGGGTYTAGTTGIFNSMQINNAGEWAFRLGSSTGVFGTTGGTPTRAALNGDVAPGTGGATYGALLSSAPRFGGNGHVAIMSNLTTGTGTPPVVVSGSNANSIGLWTGAPGSLSLQLRRDDWLTSIDPAGSVRVGAMNNLSLGVNGNGRYVMNTSLQGTVQTGNTVGNDQAILSNRNGSLEVVARRGDAAPDAAGAASASYYRTIPTGAMGFNSNGRVAFSATLRDAAGVQTSAGALYSDTVGGTMRQIAKAGDALPTIYSPGGAPLSEFAGVTWGSSFGNTWINSSDTMVMFASGLGNTGGTTNNGAILTMSPSGQFTKVVRAGDVAIVNGAPFGGDAFFQSNFSSIAINGVGQIAFTSLLSGNGVSGGPGGNNSALFAWDPAGGLCLVARTSDPFQVAPGDVRTISSIGGIIGSGGEDGYGRSLNDSGVLAFQLDFTNGTSGIFTTTIIPAPGSVGLIALAGVIACRRRRA